MPIFALRAAFVWPFSDITHIGGRLGGQKKNGPTCGPFRESQAIHH
jgi:hypothetical protein